MVVGATLVAVDVGANVVWTVFTSTVAVVVDANVVLTVVDS